MLQQFYNDNIIAFKAIPSVIMEINLYYIPSHLMYLDPFEWIKSYHSNDLNTSIDNNPCDSCH